MIREMANLIAKNRARNNISNRHEFLRKRQSVATNSDGSRDSSVMDVDMPTCARTDAIPVNRDIQMKYGVAKNEGGPLMRTVKSNQNESDPSRDPKSKGKALLHGHSDLLERFSNLEEHLAVRYGK